MNPILVKIISMVLYVFIGYSAYKLRQTIDILKKEVQRLKNFQVDNFFPFKVKAYENEKRIRVLEKELYRLKNKEGLRPKKDKK